MFSAPMVARLFDAKPGGIVRAPQGLSGNYVIARVTGIAHPRLDPRDRNFTGGMAQLAQGVAGDMSVALANAARARQGVKVNRKLVDAVTGGGG
jgi:peptidyl-prolyl cis-trans isomerase D